MAGSDSCLLLPVTAEHILIGQRLHMGLSFNHCHIDGNEKRMAADGVFRLGLATNISLAVEKALMGYLSSSTVIIANAAPSVSKDKEYAYRHAVANAPGLICFVIK